MPRVSGGALEKSEKGPCSDQRGRCRRQDVKEIKDLAEIRIQKER